MARRTTNLIDAHIGTRIRLARLEKSMSQEKLGECLSVTFQQVQKYEKGANRVGGSHLWAISQALDVPLPFFFEGLDDPTLDDSETAKVVSARNEFMATAEGIKLANRFQAIESEDTRQAVLNLLAALGSDTKT